MGDSDGNANVNQVQDISATVVFTLISYDTMVDFGGIVGEKQSIVLRLDATNTTEDKGNNVGLLGLAFGTNPDVVGVILSLGR